MFDSAKICSKTTVHTNRLAFFRIKDPSEMLWSFHMFMDAVCPIHSVYYPFFLVLKQHFPVREIFRAGPMNFRLPAFSGSPPDCSGEEPSVVTASSQAWVCLFSEIHCRPSQKVVLLYDFVRVFIFFRNGISSISVLLGQEVSLVLNIFLILQVITAKPCLLWTLFSNLVRVVATLIILLYPWFYLFEW